MKLKLTLTAFLLCLCLCAGAKDNIRRYDDSSRPVFAKKGTWSVGGTAAFSTHSNNNYSFLVIEGINSNGFSLSLTPEFCCFFTDNIAVGGKVGYSHYILNAESGAINFGNLSLGVDNFDIARQSLDLTAFARFFIPLGDARCISLYADCGLQGKFGRGKESEQHTGARVGTFQSVWKAGIIVNPGIMVYFPGNRIAVFASLGIAGFTYNRTNQIHNQVDVGARGSFSLSFMVNPTALSFGLNFFIDKKK